MNELKPSSFAVVLAKSRRALSYVRDSAGNRGPSLKTDFMCYSFRLSFTELGFTFNIISSGKYFYHKYQEVAVAFVNVLVINLDDMTIMFRQQDHHSRHLRLRKSFGSDAVNVDRNVWFFQDPVTWHDTLRESLFAPFHRTVA